jgi:hypothetical protein
MEGFTARFADMRPVLRRAESGMWLALSDIGAPIRIGVIGLTRDEAVERFRAETEAWRILLDESAVGRHDVGSDA